MQDESSESNPFPEPVVIEITDVIDLHTFSPRDVKTVVKEYLHSAHAKGFRVVRIIHGKGVGVQRNLVHQILAKSPLALSWRDAPSDAGGWGATIVELDSPDGEDSGSPLKSLDDPQDGGKVN